MLKKSVKLLILMAMIWGICLGFWPTTVVHAACDFSRIFIKTALPGPRAQELLEAQAQYESRAVSYPKLIPLAPARAKGVFIEDVDGNTFLDFGSMAGVLGLGYRDAQSSMDFYLAMFEITTTLDFPTTHRINLLKLLHRLIQARLNEDMIIHFTGPTGTDAVEAALKLAKTHTQKRKIIAFDGSYHGMTANSSSVSSVGVDHQRQHIQTADTIFLPYPTTASQAQSVLNQIKTLLDASENEVAAVIVEPIQGEGGTVVPYDGFFVKLDAHLKRHNVLFIADEVQTGFGRTGKLFASEWFGIKPDVIVFSKAISGIGAPLAGIAFKKHLNSWLPGDSIGTFRGFVPAMSSAIHAVSSLSNELFLDQVNKKGERAIQELRSHLRSVPIVHDIRGKGLMIGIEIGQKKDSSQPNSERARQIVKDLFQRGLIVELGGKFGNVIRLLPPLNISEEHLAIGLEILKEVIASN